MKKFLGEFKEFALRGNVMDLAIGVIIGAAFQAIVTSLTGDIISPLLGLFGHHRGTGHDQIRRVSDCGAELRHHGFGNLPVCEADQ